MKEKEIVILIFLGLLIFVIFWYEKKLKEIPVERIIVPMIPGVTPGFDYQTMEYYFQRQH